MVFLYYNNKTKHEASKNAQLCPIHVTLLKLRRNNFYFHIQNPQFSNSSIIDDIAFDNFSAPISDK